MKYDPEQVLCIVDSHHGVYVPQIFARNFSIKDPDDVDSENLKRLYNGPEDEYYWEAWESILDLCLITIEGKDYYLHQDGDLFAVPVGMEPPH